MHGVGLSEKQINVKLRIGENLSYNELNDVFSRINMENKHKSIETNYIKICKSVYYLLTHVKGKSRELFVELLNKDFKIMSIYKLDADRINPTYFDGWKCKCTNKKTKSFLLNFLPQTASKQNNNSLDNFKISLFEDNLTK